MGDLRTDFSRGRERAADPVDEQRRQQEEALRQLGVKDPNQYITPTTAPPKEYKSRWHQIAEEIADTVCKKNQAYGDSFAQCETFLRLLYPNGVPPDQFGRMLTLVRQWDKIKRFATNNDPEGEDPQADMVGYSLLHLAKARSQR